VVTRTPGSCMVDTDCPLFNQTCDHEQAPVECSCVNHQESCMVRTDMGTCRPSSINTCRTCQACLTDTLAGAIVSLQNASMAARADRLGSLCTNMTVYMGPLVDTSRCSSMLELLQQQPDLAQRAGALCAAMGACDASSPGACTLGVSSSARLAPGPALTGPLDTCSVEGVPGGAVPAGLVAPLGEHHALVCHIKSYACRPWPAPIAEETAVWMHMRMPVGDIADEASICTSHLC
jgi:hypothetical protein